AMSLSSIMYAFSAAALMMAGGGPATSSAPLDRPSAAVTESAGPVTSRTFTGAKANTGTVTLSMKDGRNILTLSDDFKTPDTPAPHWRLVDSAGNTYLLQRLKTKGQEDKGNRTIEVPEYIHDIAAVQIWCAWAEVVLGETTF